MQASADGPDVQLLRPDARIAVVNRGDAAVRFCQAVQEYNLERGTSLSTVALTVTEERDAWATQLADEVVEIGPARDAGVITFLDLPRLAGALRAARADAAWVGWGFVSERVEFAELCAELGVVFLGPRPEVIRLLGDKIRAKRLAESVGVPVAPWSRGPVADLDAAVRESRRIGFPLLVKATAGGGGRGIRAVADETGLAAAWHAAVAEAGSAFGDPTVFLERQLVRVRHLEVQVAGDHSGQVWAVGVRDCSVQRRRQKVLEESGAHDVPAEVLDRLCSSARALAAAAGYTGVGTLEFLLDRDTGEAAFLEMNTRLQVEHGITELTTGLDLVKLQLDLAAGRPLPDEPPGSRGYAVEARLTAEDVVEGFRPAPGRVRLLRLPSGPGLRIDTGVAEGDRLPPEFDPLVLKVMATGRDRTEALARLRRALDSATVLIEGGATTTGFLRWLLAQPALLAGDVDTGWLDERVAAGEHLPGDADLALVLAAVDLAERQRTADRTHLLGSAARGRPDLVGLGGRRVELTYLDADHAFVVHRTSAHGWVVETPDGDVSATVVPVGPDEVRVVVGATTRRAAVLRVGSTTQVELAGSTYRAHSDQAGVVRAASPAVVVQMRVRAGQHVVAGEALAVLESMKLELPVLARTDGVVREVLVSAGTQVDAGEPLLRVDVAGDTPGRVATAARVGFTALTSAEPETEVTAARRALLGFDAGPGVRSAAAEDLAVELEVLQLFGAVAGLSGAAGRPDVRTPTRGIASTELLPLFMRAPGRSQSVLPVEFVDRLRTAVQRFGARGLDGGADLDEALFRISIAERALPAVERVCQDVLRRWTLDAPAVAAALGPDGLTHLETLAGSAEAGFPHLADSARATAHQLYVRPGAARRDPDRSLEAFVLDTYRDLAPRDLRVDRGGVAADLVDGRRVHAALGPVAALPDGVSHVDLVLPALDPRQLPPVRGGTTLTVVTPDGDAESFAPESAAGGARWLETGLRGLHPETARRLELWRLREFDLTLVARDRDVQLLLAVARSNPADRRLVALVEVRDLGTVPGARGEVAAVPEVERVLLAAFDLMRAHLALSSEPMPGPVGYNRVVLHVEPLWTLETDALRRIARRFAPGARNLGLDKVLARVRRPAADGTVVERLLHMTRPAATGMSLGESDPSPHPVRPLSPRQQRLQGLRRRGLRDPYEIVDLLTSPTATVSDFPPGSFTEHDLDAQGALVPVDRPPGGNTAGVVVGLVSNATETVPEGMTRVLVLGDPSRGLGALAEPECRRVLAALRLAERLRVPLEWFTVSSGARISMDSGTENMDWVARVLGEIVRFTQGGGELNVVVCGVNVGAQPYFNAEATMLMHTRGVLVMVPGSSLLLTGKEALDFAGGVSAEDNAGIGGYGRIMGPNGQAQYAAPTLERACEILFEHYEHAYVVPGERFPRRRTSLDPVDRDVSTAPHPPVEGSDFATLGEVFSPERNAERKKPFDIRALMRAVTDADCAGLERWADMADAGSAVVWDAHLGGFPVCLVGIESRPLPRSGQVPADGPDTWTAATLFPASSKKVARALNSSSGVRPVVVLANLAGFDGSPESLRRLQLEYGAEIGRAVTNFDGPIVFCVVSRYHGGAFVVFSKSLNPGLRVLAVEGAKASVIGGSAAAAVVFARDVTRRSRTDPAVVAAETALAAAAPADRPQAEAARDEVAERVRTRVRTEVAQEFDDVHSVERALAVGSVDRIIRVGELRSALVGAVADGIASRSVVDVGVSS